MKRDGKAAKAADIPRIDHFFSLPGARADRWREVNGEAHDWARGHSGQAEVTALLDALGPFENLFAYPGSHLLGALRGYVENGQASAAASLAQRISEAILTRSYKGDVADWQSSEAAAEAPPEINTTTMARGQAMAAVDELVRISRLDPGFSWARVAIISRDWRRLGAVRAYAEKLGVPVEMANEKLPNVWRLREMQRLVARLRARPSAMLTIQDILDVLNEQPLNRWVDLIAEGIADLARELGKKTIPVPDTIEWLAEWAQDIRGAQRGLLLLTAHRSKGLEFDHVVILNGGWKALSQGEDGEAPRRLFYVAMTRARRSLAVVTSGTHAFVLADSDSEMLRKVEMPRRLDLADPDEYQVPDLASVDLSYAGRLPETNSTNAAITGAKVDDPVSLEKRDGKWIVLNGNGRPLGRMAASWAPPQGTFLVSGKVGAIVRWRKSDNEERYQTYIRRDEWETVLPELVFRRAVPSP